MNYSVRAFEAQDAQEISILLAKNFLEINSQDYPLEQMKKLAQVYSPEKILEQASYAHTYVGESEKGQIIGTATICPFWDSISESIILSLFVQPELHNQGIGSALLNQMATAPFYTRASRIEVPASRTAENFYSKHGYSIINPEHKEDEQGYIRMERKRTVR